MTQVTDEMFEAALNAYDAPRYAPYDKRILAALEAALAVREPNAGDWAAFGASDAACYKWPDDTAEHKALRAAYIEGAAEQAELIEALRPFSEWSLELKGMDDDNLLLATYDKEREGNRFGTVGDCRRARALLERLGAVIRD